MKSQSQPAKKVTAFIGSPHKKATYRAVQELETNLKSFREVDFEYVFLKDCHLENCTGCCLCFGKGEEYCPVKDDRDLLLEKLDESDGVILATPAYSFQVTALMKNFLDRQAFILRRPRFSLFNLMLFRLSRTSIRLMLDEKWRDYRYFRENGWFEADYYHDASLGFVKRVAGRLFDLFGARMVKQRLGA